MAYFISAWISSLVGQMSPSHTSLPPVPWPTGSLIRSRVTVPAMA